MDSKAKRRIRNGPYTQYLLTAYALLSRGMLDVGKVDGVSLWLFKEAFWEVVGSGSTGSLVPQIRSFPALDRA